MKQLCFLAPTRVLSTILALGVLAAGTPLVGARADDPQGGSSHNMRLVGGAAAAVKRCLGFRFRRSPKNAVGGLQQAAP